jgi:hypothetical protein
MMFGKKEPRITLMTADFSMRKGDRRSWGKTADHADRRGSGIGSWREVSRGRCCSLPLAPCGENSNAQENAPEPQRLRQAMSRHSPAGRMFRMTVSRRGNER